tara:strand:+ start:1748 stop:1942 length:195 start_codon:yes stop_codon:yes gene_type:complete
MQGEQGQSGMPIALGPGRLGEIGRGTPSPRTSTNVGFGDVPMFLGNSESQNTGGEDDGKEKGDE